MAVARKTVTVLFADVADSTALGESVDPEALRGALARWFDEARRVIERYGGTVEKFVGDSVMAVFGVPQLHEDDAVRAVRAAHDLGRALAALNEQLEPERGLSLAVRIGVNTGEVVTGDGATTLVTGDAVNVAKRLEEAADSGDVLVGTATHHLAHASATFEPAARIDAKGKSDPVDAWRLVDVDRDGPPFDRRLDTPLVGRRRELEQLQRAYGRSVAERTCQLFTLLGAAGIGKTRLACELFDAVADEATVLIGRCLPYGDGITFWPLHDVIRELGGEDAIMRMLAEDDDGELVCERLAGASDSQELFWAVRRLCETLARRGPLVLCFEDVHWAEPRFLDLIEYLAGWIREAPILLLCIARPEFLDERPAWLSGQENAASLTLTPLSSRDASALLDALGVRGDARNRIAGAAEGNPLYAEQMAAMVAEGGAVGTIPPTIQALLSARLDRLTTQERDVIERAAVCGKEFWRGAVAELTPESDRGQLGAVLLSLVRKDLIRPHRSSARPDDAFRFGHVLIRDAAYTATTKEARADLHERFADWLATDADVDLDEIIGYHLEQAYRNREALRPLDAEARALAERAADLLGRAGRRAFQRDDLHAAVKLLDRAVALVTQEDPARLELMRQLSSALWSLGEVARAEALLNGLIDAAAVAGDRRYELHAALLGSSWRSVRDPDAGWEETAAVAREALPEFERLGDDVGLAQAWRQLARALGAQSRLAEATDAAERALDHARRANASRDESRAADLLSVYLARGPMPVNDAIERIETMLERAADKPPLRANLMAALAELRAMQGEFDEARRLYHESLDTHEQLGMRLAVAGVTQVGGLVELLADEPSTAERLLRRGYEVIVDIPAWRAQHAALLGEALYRQQRYEEAQALLDSTEEPSAKGELYTQISWRSLKARLLARAGEHDAAERLIRDTTARVAETDEVTIYGAALAALAEVLHLRGSPEATQTAHRASDVFRRKGNLVAAAHVEALLSQPVTR